MLIGDVFYRLPSGELAAEFDKGVTAEYARRASVSASRNETVEWHCRNGDPTDVRKFRYGRQVAP